MDESTAGKLRDPLNFARLLWPKVAFYNKQVEILYSVVENDETFVSAGNMLGKDFIAAYVVLWFFLTRHPVRIITTSAVEHQLEGVLWGEIRNFINTAKYPLDSNKGGPILVNHLHLRKVTNRTEQNPQGIVDGVSYCKGVVAKKGEGMLGHHIAEYGDSLPRTLLVVDEASGVDDVAYTRGDTWAKRKLIIGNPFPCTNFFYRGVKSGDIVAKEDLEFDNAEVADGF